MQEQYKSASAAKRIVVKVGTSTLAYESGRLNIRRIEALVKVLADLKNSGREIIIVTSGAVGIGAGILGMKERPRETRKKQAAASVGQCELMSIYSRLFSEYGHIVGQILMTRDIIDDPHYKENAQNTFKTLLDLGVIPIVNENDTVSTEELDKLTTFNENDTLSAVVAQLSDANLLVLLSDINGLYDGDPRKNKNARLIDLVEKIDDKLLSIAGGAGTAGGTGGMITKLNAARQVTEAGIYMVIANGANPKVLYDITDGKTVGTLFLKKA